jgi:hypothetical protein
MLNGLSMTNGLAMTNGLSMWNGLATTSGLSSTSGMMTTSMGRRTVKYLARCALGPGQTLTKRDQYGVNRTFGGGVGLAQGWLNGGTSATEQKNVSACLMAHLNTAGVQVPIWLASNTPGIGWGRSSSFPHMEGTFFGSVMATGGDGKVPAYFCEGAGFGNGIVPGRLGANLPSSAYRNPWGAGAKCDNHCTKHSSGDGYVECNGHTNPITVWRAASYNPVFDTGYRYTFTSTSSRLALDVLGWSTSPGAALIQWPSAGGANQRWQIVAVATSQWKIVNVHSGKVLSNRSGTTVTQETYNGGYNDRWVIDDHNGHFKLINKATGLALKSPSSTQGAGVVTGTYAGASNTDWDIAAVESLD